MDMTIAIVGAIFAIFSIILLHELGHFIAARCCGIKVLRFSVGFGFPLLKYVGKSGTEYVLSAFPLGGYVRMLGESDSQALDHNEAHLAFSAQVLWKRMVVVLAGPAINFLLAIVAFWGVFLMGVTHVNPVIGSVTAHSIAAEAGLKTGDRITRVGSVQTPNWQRVMMALIMHMGDRGTMTVWAKSPGGKLDKPYRLDLAMWSVDRRQPELLKSLGLSPYQPKVPPVLAEVMPGSAAMKAGLRAGDRILSIDGQRMTDWQTVVSYIRARPKQVLSIAVERGGKQQRLMVTTQAKEQGDHVFGYLGAEVDPPAWPEHMIQKASYSFLSAWLPALDQTRTLTAFNFIVLAKMITGKISLHTLGGPITIFQAAGKASQAGLQVYLGFIAFISLTVGFLNLLPIPGLDGGHWLFQLIEAIFRRPVPERYQMVGLSIGVAFLVFLMVQATINDVLRLL